MSSDVEKMGRDNRPKVRLVFCLYGGGYVYAAIYREGQDEVAKSIMDGIMAWCREPEERDPKAAAFQLNSKYGASDVVLYSYIAGFYFEEIKPSSNDLIASNQAEIARLMRKQLGEDEPWNSPWQEDEEKDSG